MASVPHQIMDLLEKVTTSDEDLRFMHTKDLISLIGELQEDIIELDNDSERKVVCMLLKLLDDSSYIIQDLVVKNLGPSVKKFKERQVELLVETLCLNMVSDKEQLRDISILALKFVIEELPQARGGFSGCICEIIAVRLTAAIERQDDTSVQLKALDIITDLLLRSMPALQNFHGSILAALLPQLSSQCQDKGRWTKIHKALQEHDIPVRKAVNTSQGVKVYPSNISSHRELTRQLDKSEIEFTTFQVSEDRDLSVVLRGVNVSSSDQEILDELRVKFPSVKSVHRMRRGDDDEEDEETDVYSDDADMSWKVRRSAVKCLEAIILTRHNLSTELSRLISTCLISRFKEHEENVKSDIFHAYIALLKSSNMNFYKSEMHLVNTLQGLLCRKNMRTREECFNLLREVCLTLPGAFSIHIRALIPGILYSLSKHSLYTMKVEVLSFMYCLLTSHQPQVFHRYMGLLVPPVINAVGGRWYFKVTAEALDVLQELIKILRPLDVDSDFVFNPFTEDIYGCTLKQLETAAVQEVKEKAISTMGQVICNLGDHLKDQLPFCLPLFVDRLTDETTRLTTVKALTKIAGSPLGIKLPILPEIMPVLGLFLRKNRDLKLSTLQLIDRLLNNYHGDLNVQLLEPIVDEVPPLLDESDLNIAHWTLTILRSIATHHPRALKGIRHTIMPQVRQLVKSPLLRGKSGSTKAPYLLLHSLKEVS
nr:unnamed protein product [Callosobruchus chinensis]